MVPKSIAKKLRGQCTYANSDFFKSATIMFADIFGFTQIRYLFRTFFTYNKNVIDFVY